MLLMVDNYDSFTHNVVRYFQELGARVEVVRNDHIEPEAIAARGYHGIILSPGPCTPSEAGQTLNIIDAYRGRLPILGVCLGHQAIGQALGAKVVRAEQVMHGKTSVLEHTGQGLFEGLPNPLTVARYHSLVIDPASLPVELVVDAWTHSQSGQREIMAIRHRDEPMWGIQYHPEAIQTEAGHALFQNFLKACQQ